MQQYLVWKLLSIAIIAGFVAGQWRLRRNRNRLSDKAVTARRELGQRQETHRRGERRSHTEQNVQYKRRA